MSDYFAPESRAARQSAGLPAHLIRAASLRGLFALAFAATVVQAALRVAAFGGLDHATRCVHLAGRLARAGITFAIVSVSPDCPAETVTPGGDARHLVACAAFAALAVVLIHLGTSARAARMCKSVRALAHANVWRRVLALADTPVLLPLRSIGEYREPGTSPRRPWRGFCGTRGPPVAA